MIILSYNPGHDGAFAYLEDGQLVASVESEKTPVIVTLLWQFRMCSVFSVNSKRFLMFYVEVAGGQAIRIYLSSRMLLGIMVSITAAL